MTAGGGEWAEVEVGASLNWDDVDNDLRERLERASERAATAVRKNFAKLEVATRKQFERIADNFDRQMDRLPRSATRAGGRVVSSWSRSMRTAIKVTEVAATKIQRQLDGIDDVTARVHVEQTGAEVADLQALSRTLSRLDRAGDMTLTINVVVNNMGALERLALLIRALPNRHTVNIDVDSNPVGRAIKSIGGLSSAFLSGIGTIGKWTAIAGAATVAVGGMLPAVAALSTAIGATLPAAAGAAAAGIGAMVMAIATIKTAFAGVGDALKSAFDPADAEKFNEALAKLSPQARRSVLAIQALGTEFKKVVQQPVQDAMFAGLATEIVKLRGLLPALRDSMVTVADGFNEGAKSALSFVNSAKGASIVKTFLGESANMSANLGSALGNLVPGIIAIGAGSAQVFGPMTDGIAGAARSLSDMLVQAQQSGRMAEIFNQALAVARQLGAVFSELGGIIGGVFRAAAAAGDGQFLGSLMTSLESINAWVSGPGAQALTSFFASTAAAVGTVMPILLQVAGIIGGQVAPMIANLITTIGPAVSGLVGGFGQAIAALQPAMAPLGSAISAIATALTPVLPILGQLIATFVQIAGPIISALAQALGPVLVSVGQSLIVLFQALMPAVQPIADLFVALGPVIAQLASMLAGMLGAALQVLVPVLVVVVNALAQMLPVVAGVLQMLQPFTTAIGAVAGALVVAYGAFKVFKTVSTIISAVRTAWQLLSLAFTMSPIGMIITAIAALAAGLYLFFTKTEVGKQLWDKIWGGIKATFEVVWAAIQSVWNTVWPILQAGFKMLGDAALWLWQNAIQPAFNFIGQVIGVVATVVRTYIGVYIAIFKALGAVAMWLWNNAIVPAFNAIKAIIGVVWGVVSAIFNAWLSAIKFVGNIVLWLWNNVVTPAFAAIQSVISAAWGVITGVFDLFIQGVQKVGSFFVGLADTLRDAAGKAKDWVVEKFTAVIDFFRGLPGKIKEFAGAIWEPIRESARTVFNAIANLWNNTVGRLSFRAPDWVPGIGGKGFDVPDIPMMRTGGLFRGDGTGTSDSNLVALSDGEWVNPAAQTNARTMPWLQAIRGGWTPPRWLTSALLGGSVQKLAEGGAVGGRTPYGKPIGYSGPIDDPWVQALEKKFGIKASTYAGHQEKDGKNKGIDWSGPTENMQRFAEFAKANKSQFEQVIWQNPTTGQQIGVADGELVGPGTAQPGYYRDDWSGHQDHVHTRQSYAVGEPSGSAPGINDTPGSGATLGGSMGGGASSTPIGSGIGSSSSGGSSSWGNSGGGSKFNSADEAAKANVVPVWVENWPATMGGGGGSLGGSTAGMPADLGGGTPAPAGGGAGGGIPAGAGIGKLTRSSSKDEVGEAIYWEARKRGYSHEDAIALISTGLQESGLRPDAIGGGGAWHGVYQQDTSYAGRDDPNKNIDEFLKRLDAKRKSPGASKDIWKNIFWLQQAPGIDSAEGAYAGGRQAYLSEIQSQRDEAKRIADAAAAKAPKQTPVPVTPQGTVPVTPTDTAPAGTANLGGDLGGTPPTSAPTTMTGTGTGTPSSADMPFGRARADAWAREQDFAGQARDWAIGAVTGEMGAFLEPVGADALFKKAVDELLNWLKTQPQQAPATVKYAETVNNYGMDGDKTKAKATEGMTAVLETYRQG